MDKKKAIESLLAVVNAAVQKGVFNDANSVVIIHQALQYLEALPETQAGFMPMPEMQKLNGVRELTKK